jgi:hypothetical protein
MPLANPTPLNGIFDDYAQTLLDKLKLSNIEVSEKSLLNL